MRLSYLAGGVTPVFLSADFEWLPVLGWEIAFLGLTRRDRRGGLHCCPLAGSSGGERPQDLWRPEEGLRGVVRLGATLHLPEGRPDGLRARVQTLLSYSRGPEPPRSLATQLRSLSLYQTITRRWPGCCPIVAAPICRSRSRTQRTLAAQRNRGRLARGCTCAREVRE